VELQCPDKEPICSKAGAGGSSEGVQPRTFPFFLGMGFQPSALTKAHINLALNCLWYLASVSSVQVGLV
jgi:hypothetical protein